MQSLVRYLPFSPTRLGDRLGGGVYSLLRNNPSSPLPRDEEGLDSDDDIANEKFASQRWPSWRRIPTLLFRLIAALYLKFLLLFIPSFIPALYHRIRRSPPAERKKLSATAYLDGLRGVAALVVYIFHYTYLWFPILRHGWGSSEKPGEDLLFWQLPVIRVLHSGRASVTIFFVISGYVLTIKTLTLIHQHKGGENGKVLDALSGSLFRRPFRLYLPILVSTGIAAIMVRFDRQYHIYQEGAPPFANNMSDQFWHWVHMTLDMANPFRSVVARQNLFNNAYNEHLWTIPVEFKGSLLVFVLLLAFCRTRTWLRLAGVAGAGYWQMVSGDSDQTLFCAGLLLAELSILLPPHNFVYSGNKWLVRHGVTVIMFLVAVHFMSYPENFGPKSPGFRSLSASSLLPKFYTGNEERTQQFWISVGSIIFILALMYSPPLRQVQQVGGGEEKEQQQPLLQRLFTNGFAQYLGHISYSLYLWHGVINHIVGMRYLHPAWDVLQAKEIGAQSLEEGEFLAEAASVRAASMLAYFWKWVPAMILNTFVLFWVSDVFNRLVDVNAVKLTRRIGNWAMAKS
ncbi:acyltransferase [Diplogelasinospora grovesii]|uniref:Acyltransferase n=1 Tax=Diplogelasinospora grovesii TaxID=303347 RepID=A0AAN6ND27_9PEZI|nr:acyltransferase [Diplogelasinospora grovesii]